jgi:hypothetical protein
MSSISSAANCRTKKPRRGLAIEKPGGLPHRRPAHPKFPRDPGLHHFGTWRQSPLNDGLRQNSRNLANQIGLGESWQSDGGRHRAHEKVRFGTVQSLIVDCRQFSLARASALQQNSTKFNGGSRKQ